MMIRTCLVTMCLIGGSGGPWQAPAVPARGHVLEGHVEDAVGRLPGAAVRLVELGRETVTGADGAFSFAALPRGTFTLGVHLPGYASAHRSVSVPADGPVVVRLELDWRVQEEVTVTATPWATRPVETAPTTASVEAEDIRRAGDASLGDALDAIPGVANIPTGDALGTPVIRGISENRIRVLNDGFPVNHQQFSFRHSPNVEPALADRVEVVRGPASVLYGPEAMGGVINVVQAPLPTAHGVAPAVHGQATLGYGGNSNEWSGQALVEGARGGLGWRAGLVRRDARDLRTPDGRLSHTSFSQTNGVVALGYSGPSGRARVRWHHWSDDQAFHQPSGFRLDLVDDLLAGDAFVPTRAGEVELLGGWQMNGRRAFPAHLGGRPAEDLALSTGVTRASLYHPPWHALRGRVAGEYQRVRNRQRVPGELLPDYLSHTYAAMGYEEWRLGSDAGGRPRLIVNGGLRWDGQHLRVFPDPGRNLPDGVGRGYGSLSGSAGVVVRLNGSCRLAGTMGRGWRPPNPFELFANGVHGGVSAVQIGNPALEEESAVSADVSLRWDAPAVRASVTAYRNTIDRFIYLADTGEFRDVPEGHLPVFTFRQARAVLRGLEADVELTPCRWLRLAAGGSRAATENRRTGARLPQTPANRLDGSVEVGRDRHGRLIDPQAALDVVLVGRGRVSGPDEPFGTPTSPYTLLNGRAGAGWPIGAALLRVDLVIRNLLDRRYTDFLWTYKPWAPSPGRDLRVIARVTF